MIQLLGLANRFPDVVRYAVWLPKAWTSRVRAAGRPSPPSTGARLVLALCGLMSVGGIELPWRAEPRQTI
jgi:hypothetical protein